MSEIMSFALTKGQRTKRQLYIFNLVDITKLPCYPDRRSTTVS